MKTGPAARYARPDGGAGGLLGAVDVALEQADDAKMRAGRDRSA